MIVACLAACMGAGAQSVYPGQFAGRFAKENVVTPAVESFDLKDVRLLPGRMRENMKLDSAWMVSIAADRLLHSFRTSAGMYSSSEGGYMTVRKLGGWESLDCDIRGHITGHMMSACALMWAATGDEVFKAKGDSLVSGLAEVQKVLGTGYLAAFPEELFNRNLRGESVWVPWYTMHKILAGLIDQYLYADNSQALEVAKGIASWAYGKLSGQSEETRRTMLRNEFGGVNEAFYNLYAITGDERCLWLARWFYHDEVIDPLKEGRDELAGKHCNTFIPKILGEARNYELTGSEESSDAAEFFWNTVTEHHLFAPGCMSQKEHFFDPDHFSDYITGLTGETCCTYNMLKLSRHLFCWTADERIADYYERALFNHIMGQQDPETGMVSYFLPLGSGTHKVYSTPERSFWCCVGSSFESHAKYAEAIYYHNDNGIYVNLFIPSTVNWADKGFSLRQETSFPNEETTIITVNTTAPVKTTVYLRYPSWSGQPTVKVNGRKMAVSQNAGSYIAISRTWKDGDRIEADFPMSLHLETAPDNPQIAAVLYGPIVLAGERGTEGMQAPAPFSNPEIYNDYYTYDYHIPDDLKTMLNVDPAHPEDAIQRIDATQDNGDADSPAECNSLTFTTSDGDTLIPLYDAHRQRYVVYWNIIR